MQVKKQLHVAGNKLHQRRGAGAMAPSLLVQLHQKLLSASEAGLDAIEAKRRPPKLWSCRSGDQPRHSPKTNHVAICPRPCPPRQELEAAEAVVLAATQRPDRCIHLLRPGRLVRVRAGARDWGWGVVVSVLHTPPRAEGGASAPTAPKHV